MTNSFWKSWEDSDDIRKVDRVKELLKHNMKFKDEVELHAYATLINSYFVDLHDYTINEWLGGINEYF